jgi:NADPH:quinone reductase-like Zn-dependent oxidoreductase
LVHVSADVRNWLKADGHDVFLDYDRQDGIESGDLWEERLYERLRGADAVVCLVTSDYVMSQYISYHDAQAREQVCRILREIDATGGAGWPDDRSPFPGLRVSSPPPSP